MEPQEQPMDHVAASSTEVATSTEEEAAHEEDAGVVLQSPQVSIVEFDKLALVEQYSSAPSSPYFSPRIQSLRQHRSEISPDHIQFQIEASKGHWTEMSPEARCCNPIKHQAHKWGFIGRELGGAFRLGRRLLSEDSEILVEASVQKSREVFERLKRARHPFFRDFNLVLGEKIGEGGQADIHQGTCSSDNSVDERPSECVVKVFKRGLDLRSLQSQWPSKLCQKIRDSYNCTGTSEILGGTLLEDGRCSFVLQRYWGDLRTLIDHNMLENQRPPFQESVALRILWQIARGMVTLHDNNILHRDLKASNVLLNIYSHGLFPEYPDCYVADFECSNGVVGTGFWRAPEILRALGNHGFKAASAECTKMADVYSFGMLCYEVLTGRIPFEDKATRDYNVVLSGQRPCLPTQYGCCRVFEDLVKACWDADPLKRPSFKKICGEVWLCMNKGRDHSLLRWLTQDEFPYFGWRGKEQDVSMVRWRWYNPGHFGDSREVYLVPYTATR
jgi:serine/threonine protein kinase